MVLDCVHSLYAMTTSVNTYVPASATVCIHQIEIDRLTMAQLNQAFGWEKRTFW